MDGAESFKASKSGILLLLPILAALGLAWWWLTARTGVVLDVVLSLIVIVLAMPFVLATLRMLTLKASLDADGLTHGRSRVDWDDVQAVRLIQVAERGEPTGRAGRRRPARGHLEVFALRAGRLSRLRLSWFVQGKTGPLPERFLTRLNDHRTGRGLEQAVVEVVRR